jgi:hypothetical protein
MLGVTVVACPVGACRLISHGPSPVLDGMVAAAALGVGAASLRFARQEPSALGCGLLLLIAIGASFVGTYLFAALVMRLF